VGDSESRPGAFGIKPGSGVRGYEFAKLGTAFALIEHIDPHDRVIFETGSVYGVSGDERKSDKSDNERAFHVGFPFRNKQ
jgi:hypothetical protein